MSPQYEADQLMKRSAGWLAMAVEAEASGFVERAARYLDEAMDCENLAKVLLKRVTR